MEVLDRPDLTGQTEAPAEPAEFVSESFGARFRLDAHETARMLRRPLMPHAVTGSVMAVGLGAHAIVASGSVAATPSAFVLGAVAYPVALIAGRKVKQKAPRWSGRTVLGGLAAATWLTLAPYGVGFGDAAALVAAEFAVSAAWWQSVRLGYSTGEAEPVAETAPYEPVELTAVEQIVADWRDYNGCSGGPLPASMLMFPEAMKHGTAFDLRLQRGRQTLNQARMVIDKIADGLGIGVEDLVLEPHPTNPAPGMCRLQVLTDSPIKGDVIFDGPRRVGGEGYGLLELGPYADGAGEALYRLYTPGSMWSGVIIGGTGIGKSRVIENIVISAMSGGDTIPWFIDPQGGASSPALAEHADWFANLATADQVLDSALAILDGRGEESSFEGWTGFTPSPERPGILIVIDECHNIFKTRAEDWAKIAKQGRKLGVALLLVSQEVGLDTFGNAPGLRSSVMEGNAIALRSTSNETGQLMPGLDVDPKTLPQIPGYAFMQGNPTAGTRTAPFRNRDTGKTAGEWLAAQPMPTLDTLAATCTLAAGTWYRDRHVSTDSGRTASAERVRKLRAGHLPEDLIQGTAEAQSTIPDLNVVVFPSFADHRARIDAELAAEADEGRKVADLIAAAAELSDSHRAVLAAIANGITRPKGLQDVTGKSPRRVQELLTDLLRKQLITKDTNAYGHYQVA